MQLQKISETTTSITLGWSQVPKAEWYLFYANGVRVSNAPAFDKNGVPKTSIKFSKGGEPYEVVVITRTGTGQYGVDVGVYTGAPTPQPVEYGHREGPRGPLATRTGSLWLRDGDGAVTEKIYITSSPDYGISNMRWPYVGVSTGLWNLRDCKVENVSANPPRSMDGTGESGLWVGERALAERLETRGAAWMGLWTGAACRGSRFYDCNFQSELIPAYLEHITTDVEFHYCTFGGEQNEHSSSINAEWWYRDSYGSHLPYGGVAGSFNVKFFNCNIYCPAPPDPNDWRAYQHAGAFLDAGTFAFLFQHCRFWGPGSAVGMPNKMVDPTKPNSVVDCKFDNAGKQVYYHDNMIGT